MKNKRNKKNMILTIISLIMLMFSVGCSNKDFNDKQDKHLVETINNPTLSGDVTKVDGNMVNISQAKITAKGNKKGYKKGTEEFNKNITTFKVNKDTDITIRNLYDNGMKHEDAKGTISDIKIDSLVDVWGKDDGNIVTAKNVIVYIFN